MSIEPVIAAPGPPLTVVVPTRDRVAQLRGALRALGSALRDGDSIIVVDSASRGSGVREAAIVASARPVRCDRPGASRARNAGWRASDTDVVAFIDDDCRPRPGWAQALVDALAHPSHPDFVTGRVVVGDQQIGRAQLTLSVTAAEEPMVFVAGDDIATIGHGANMAWRRTALLRIGGFDEEMGPGAPLRAAEDQDAFWRALRAGGSGRFDPAAVVEHRQWRGRAGQLRAYYGYGVGSGALAVKEWRSAAGPPRTGSTVRRALVELAWRQGAVPIARSVAARYEMGVAAETVKMAGSLAGARRARRMALVGGHFSSPPR